LALIQSYLSTGYNGGTWTGTSANGVITSSAAATNHVSGNNNTGIGYADSSDGSGVNTMPNSIELMYTLYGDANLSQSVNSLDLQSLLNHFNQAGGWTSGDFNYTNTVNSLDLQALLNAFNQTLGSQAPVPTVTAATKTASTISSTSSLSPSVNAVTLSPTTSSGSTDSGKKKVTKAVSVSVKPKASVVTQNKKKHGK